MFFDHYPYTNFHNVNLDWVLQAVKAWGHTVEENDQAFHDLEAANASFKAFVTAYLHNLDVADEINDKLDQMLADGVLTPYMIPYIQSDVSAWLAQHITPTTPAVDASLTIPGAAADSATTGKRLSQFGNTFDSALTDRSAIKNAIFAGGWYDIKAEGHAIGGITPANSVLYAALPVQFGDCIFANVQGGGTNDGGARTYAFTDENGIIIKRSGMNEAVSRYLIAPAGSAMLYIQNDLTRISTGYYAYVGYNVLSRYRNVTRLSNGFNIFTNYTPGFYSAVSNANFPHPNQTSRRIETMLLNVSPGEVYFIQGSTQEPDIPSQIWGESIIFDASMNVLKDWQSARPEYSRAVYIPESGAYMATNTFDEYENALVAKYDVFNALEYTTKNTAWESGGINDTSGNNTNYASRIRNVDKIAIYRDKKIEIALPKGYIGLIYKYDELGNYLGYIPGWTDKIRLSDLPADTHYIRFTLKSTNNPNTDISSALSYIAENTIIRDSIENVNFNIENVQEITTAINYYPDSVASGKTLTNNGDVVDDASYKLTDFVRIPTKYNRILLYTHAFSERGDAPVVAFYNENKTFIEMFTNNAGSISNADSYVYARAVFPVADEKCDFTFSNETGRPDYAPPKKYLLYTNDLNSYGRNVISDGTVTAIINTGLKYLGNEEFGYGTEYTAFAETCIKTTKDTHTSSSAYTGERYQMDCSTYVLLMMMGISPECSRYYYTKNIPANWGYRFNRLVEYEGYVYGVRQTGNTKRLFANSIAEYAYKNGYLFLVNDDLSNIRPGDIFFLSNQGASYEFFENIGHCGMVVESIQLENGGRTIVTFEGNGGSTSPCKLHTYTTRAEKMIYAARFPIAYVHSNDSDLASFSEAVTTALTGVSGDTIDIGTVTINRPFETGRVYTVCVQCDLPDNCYLKLKENGMSHMGVANETVLKRPDGYRTFHIFAKNTDTIRTTGSVTVQAVCTGNVTGSAILSMIRVYDGFVSPEFT